MQELEIDTYFLVLCYAVCMGFKKQYRYRRYDNMCNLPNKIRRKKYRMMREVGATPGWAARVRDFTQPKFELALNNGRKR